MPPPFMDPARVVKTLRGLGERSAGFAYASAKTPAEPVLAVALDRDGDALLGLVKKEMKVEKAFAGSVRLVGGNPRFTVDGNPGGLQKLIEEWLKRQRSPLKPTVVGAGGPPPGEDPEDEEEAEPEDSELFGEEAIRKHIALARKGPVNFAFGFGAGPEEDSLGLHRRMAPEKLVRRIREQFGSKRHAHGTATVDGNVATFTTEKAPGGLEKRLRLLLARHGLRLQVEIVLPPGVEPEADPDEIPVDAPPRKEPSLREMVAELAELNPAVRELAQRFPRETAALRERFGAARAALDTAREGGPETLAVAREALDRLRAMIRDLGAPPPMPPEEPPPPTTALPSQAELVDAVKALAPGIKGLVERFPRHVGPLREQYDQVRLAVRKADNDDANTLVAARDAVAVLEAMIRAMEASPPSDDDLDAELERVGAAFQDLRLEAEQLGREFPRHSSQLEQQIGLVDDALAAEQVDEAEEALARLRKMVGFLSRQTPEGAEHDPITRYRKARRTWMDARRSLVAAVHKLTGAIVEEYGKGALATPIRRRTDRLLAVTRTLDTRLLDALDEVIDAGTPELRAEKRLAALSIVQSYADYVAKDPLLGQIDDNPFVQLRLKPLMTQALDGVRALMEPARQPEPQSQ